MISLSPFQIVGLLALGSLLIMSLGIAARRRRMANFAWVGVWLGGVILMLYPELSATMARALGIQRGADLVVYSFVIVSANALFVSYLRYRKLEQTLTLLVRHIAIRDAREPGASPAPTTAGLEKGHGKRESAEIHDRA